MKSDENHILDSFLSSRALVEGSLIYLRKGFLRSSILEVGRNDKAEAL